MREQIRLCDQVQLSDQKQPNICTLSIEEASIPIPIQTYDTYTLEEGECPLYL